MSLLPPSEDQEFTSREAVLEALQSHARSHGYAVTTRRYNARDGAKYLKCGRGGEYKPRNGLTTTNQRRDTGTRLIDCHFFSKQTLRMGRARGDHLVNFSRALNHVADIYPPGSKNEAKSMQSSRFGLRRH